MRTPQTLENTNGSDRQLALAVQAFPCVAHLRLFKSKVSNRIAQVLTEQTVMMTSSQISTFLQAEGVPKIIFARALKRLRQHGLIEFRSRNLPGTAVINVDTVPMWQNGWGAPSTDEVAGLIARISLAEQTPFVPTTCVFPTERLMGLVGRNPLREPSAAEARSRIRLNELLIRFASRSLISRLTWQLRTEAAGINLHGLAAAATVVLEGNTKPTLILSLSAIGSKRLNALIEQLNTKEINYELH